MSGVKSYRELQVWAKAKELSVKIYQSTMEFPKHEMFGLTNQLRRASVSVPSNIAEGFARFHTKEFIRFLRISLGSLYELSTQLEIALEIKYLDKETYNHLSGQSFEIEKMLNSFINKLNKRINQQ